MLEIFIQTFVLYFIAIDPLGNTTLFLIVTQRLTIKDKIKTALEATTIATIILLFFAFLGNFILSSLNISFSAFTIAGGIILFIISLEMLFGKRNQRKEEGLKSRSDKISIFPLAIPLLAGPAAREVIGYENDLMLEAYMGWNLEYSKKIIPELVKYKPKWLEEPVIPDDIAGYAELNALGDIPIAGGEHEFSFLGFKHLLELKAVSYIQYDANRVGGITVGHKINSLAEKYNVPVVPHAGQMHNFHLTMSSNNCPFSEYFPVHQVEIGNELFYYLFKGEPEPKNGFINLDDNVPGLGISINEKYKSEFKIIE